MAANTGTLIPNGAPVKLADSNDDGYVAEANDLQGGHFQVATLAERDTLRTKRRVAGMQCHVVETGRTYRLEGGTSNASWIDILMTDDRLKEIVTSGAYEILSQEADTDGVILSGAVQWPDGSPGTYTRLARDSVFARINAFTITYGGTPQRVVTQSLITRDANGAPITKPPLTVSSL